MASLDRSERRTHQDPVDGLALDVPAVVGMRAVVMSATASACRIYCPAEWEHDRVQRLTFDVVAAVAEAFVHIVSRGHRTRRGRVRLEITTSGRSLVMRLIDHGESHDPVVMASPLDSHEPEVGAMLLTTFVDRISYHPGSPNVLTMVKSLRRAQE